MANFFPVILNSLILIDEQPPPAGCHSLAKLLRSHCLHNFRKHERSYSERGQSLYKRAESTYTAAWDKFLKWWNFKLVFGTEGLYIHYTLPTATSTWSKESIATEMAKAAVGLLMHSIPGKPEKGKWTKHPAAVDYLIVALLPAQLMKYIILEADRWARD